MPVEDLPISERVRITDEFRYGCWCLPPAKPGYMTKNGLVTNFEKVPDGVINTARYRMKYVEHTMSINCRNIDWHKDTACRGCTSEKDTEYIERQTELQKAEVRQVLSQAVRSS